MVGASRERRSPRHRRDQDRDRRESQRGFGAWAATRRRITRATLADRRRRAAAANASMRSVESEVAGGVGGGRERHREDERGRCVLDAMRTPMRESRSCRRGGGREVLGAVDAERAAVQRGASNARFGVSPSVRRRRRSSNASERGVSPRVTKLASSGITVAYAMVAVATPRNVARAPAPRLRITSRPSVCGDCPRHGVRNDGQAAFAASAAAVKSAAPRATPFPDAAPPTTRRKEGWAAAADEERVRREGVGHLAAE